MRWELSFRADQLGRVIADRHYNRQKVGAKQFVPPGACVVLVIPGAALWVTSWPKAEYVKHAWPGAWINSTFRNERGRRMRSSELIREAIAATRYFWPEPPSGLGVITFVDEREVRPKKDPGYCYLAAGFTQLRDVDGKPVRTKSEGHLVFQMLPDAMPRPAPPCGPN